MTAKVVRAYADQQMVAAGSNLTTAIITRILATRPELSQRELAVEMGVEAPTMARHMERLEADGVVTRTRDRVDRRLLRVSLTDRGLELHHRLWKVSQHTNEQLSAAFTDQELAQFESSLDRIAEQASALLEREQEATG
jgi:MarR family transcriptional regulator for hemolysin